MDSLHIRGLGMSWQQKIGFLVILTGVIAQEVLKINPEADSIDNGFMKVDYN